MSKSNKVKEDFGAFAFKESTKDISKLPTFNFEERDLEQELFGRKGLRDKVDALETELGIKPRQQKILKSRRKNQTFVPSKDEDKELLDQLMNDEKFRIIVWKDTWTVQGDYKVFVIYEEYIADEDSKIEENLEQPLE